MRKVILVSIILLSQFQIGCSALSCGCGGDDKPPAPSSSNIAADTGDKEVKDCGCQGCKHNGSESCSMKK